MCATEHFKYLSHSILRPGASYLPFSLSFLATVRPLSRATCRSPQSPRNPVAADCRTQMETAMPKPTVPWSNATGPSDEQRRERRTEAAHDLEAHMEELRVIDKVRKASARMRDNGRDALSRLKLSCGHTLYDQWKRARVCLQYARDSAQAEESVAQIAVLVDQFSLKALKTEYAPVLAAAEAMRMNIATGHLAISKATMLSWYWVVREIFTAARPDWCIGGARAADPGWVTAYSTYQCVRALCDLAEVLERTAELVDQVRRADEHLRTLRDPAIPAAWRGLDEERLRLELQTDLQLASHKVVFELSEMIESKLSMEKLIDEVFRKNVKVSLATLDVNLCAVCKELDNLPTADWPSLTGHEFAMDAVRQGISLTRTARGMIEEDTWMNGVARLFRSAALGVRDSMDACKRYLSSVIDTQLAASNHTDTRTWEPGELAYAAPAYALTVGDEPESYERERLRLAAQLICFDLSADGTLTGLIPFHEDDKHIQYTVHTDELLGAVAEVIRVAHMPVDRLRVSHMFHYFKRQCAYDDDDSVIGWYKEFDHRRSEPDLITSADAVESLASLNRMLDEGINEMILDHFAVPPSNNGVRLGELFYADYGFAQEGVRRLELHEHQIGRESLALTMQRMRAHVTRAGGKVCTSLVLHGPGGTGKTMLIEALARTCKVPLVEVTPSDLAKSGEANVEGRARAVFEALAMLSRVVILFDEFDPILKRRDDSGEKDTNFYTFVTPGMLPKLKALQESAKERKFAYALITNLVGTLDIPAIRKGRFDEVVGVYPPDPLSRAGYFARVASMLAQAREPDWDKGTFAAERLMNVVAQTRSIGMTAATAAGWFRAKDGSPLDSGPVGYLYRRCKQWKADFVPEDKFKGIRGVGRFAEREYLQWGLLSEWDEQIHNFANSKAFGEKKGREKTWNGLLQWPGSKEAIAAVGKLHVEMTAKPGDKRKRARTARKGPGKRTKK
jgi:hypothetical protein